jgi:hypothetical protein
MSHKDPGRGRKEPLFRRVNTATHHVHHDRGGEFRHERSRSGRDLESTRGSMHPGRKHGLDYTPLFRFLLSKAGRPWAEVHSEAVSRLDKEAAIWWMVAAPGVEPRSCVRTGDNSYFSGLFIDADGILRVVDPTLTAENFIVSCTCCTHTFNGERVAPPPGVKF